MDSQLTTNLSTIDTSFSKYLTQGNFDTLNGELIEKLITMFGYIFSSMAIAVHLFIHCTTDLFRNLPGHLLASNCVLLFLQYCFSMVYLTIDSKHSTWEPQVKETLKLYDYYFTAYIWSVLTRVQFAMAFDLWRCLKTQTTNIRFVSQQIRKFFKFMLVCWLSPFLELALLWAVQRMTVKTEKNCLLCVAETTQPVLFIYFISDFILMVTNFLLYFWCLYFIYQTRSQVKSSNQQTSSFVFYVKVCGRLFIMSEVNYTLLILVYHFDVAVLKQLFTNFMAYHGAIVFAVIVMQKTLLKKQQASTTTDSENTTGMGKLTTTHSQSQMG